jgi:hypothetical protein
METIERGRYSIFNLIFIYSIKDIENASKCTGALYIKEIFDNDTSKYFTYTNNNIDGNKIANPCGIIAKYVFNGIY